PAGAGERMVVGAALPCTGKGSWRAREKLLSAALAKMQGQPDAVPRWAGPLHAVPAMGGQVQIAARPQQNLTAIREGDDGFTLQQQDPFFLLLIVPAVRRAAVAEGDDALD